MKVVPVKDLLRRLRPRAGRASDELGYVPRPDRLRRDSRVVPLRTGRDAFPVMLAALRAARRTIEFEMYIFRDDVIGREFQQALIERARAGVEVRVLLDALGSFGLSARFVEELENAGVRYHEFHPVAPWRPRFGLNKRNHKKIMIVDDRVAFTGGINIGDEYRPVEEGGGGWYDWHAQVEGPAVSDLAQSFRTTWLRAGGDEYGVRECAPPVEDAPAKGVQVIDNARLRQRARMPRAYRWAIARSQRSIDIMNAYFIPPLLLRRGLAAAAKRGVRVRVIVPSTSDVKAVRWASRYLYTSLLERGVRIYEWPERMMHAKAAQIDGVWTTIGSFNLDRRSFQHNVEVGVVVIDRELGRRAEEQFEHDLAQCPEVVLATWRSRPKWEKCVEWFFYQLRYWL